MLSSSLLLLTGDGSGGRGSGEADDVGAPEEVSTAHARDAVLQEQTARKEAIKLVLSKHKEERRRRDCLFKEQALAKKTLKGKRQVSVMAVKPTVGNVPQEGVDVPRGYTRLPRARAMGRHEREAVARLVEERQAFVASMSSAPRVSVALAFKAHRAAQRREQKAKKK